MLRLSWRQAIIGALMLSNTFIGFGGLRIYDMTEDQRQEYYESGENPVTNIVIRSDENDTWYFTTKD